MKTVFRQQSLETKFCYIWVDMVTGFYQEIS